MSGTRFLQDETKHGPPSAPTKDKKSAFRRAMSRKKSVKIASDAINSSTEASEGEQNGIAGAMTRGMSRKRNLCHKIAGSKDEPVLGSRARTGPSTRKAKERVVQQYPGLAVMSPKSKAEELVFQGPNSIRAEVIDLNTMLFVMQDNMKMLTHTAVERFFEWIPLFSVYLERYMLVEEDLIMKWIEKKAESLRGELRPSARMVLRGKIQKQIQGIQDVQDEFKPQLPAGERLSRLVDVVHAFTKHIEEYVTVLTTKLPSVITQHWEKGEIDKIKIRIVRHVVAHVGYQDFIALYTRWMRPGELLEWKTKVLFPCDFKFFSYSTWDKDMDFAHYQIAAQFAEALEEENAEAIELNKQSKADFDRALASRQQMEPYEEFGIDGLTIEATEEKEYEEE